MRAPLVARWPPGARPAGMTQDVDMGEGLRTPTLRECSTDE